MLGLNRGWPARGARGSAAAILLLVLLAWPAAAADRSFAIERFAVAIDVQPDGGLAVQETLTVSFRGRHNGIFRSIPVRDTRHGFELGLRLHTIVVLDEAHQPLRTEVSYPGRSVRIKAWVPGAENFRHRVQDAMLTGPRGASSGGRGSGFSGGSSGGGRGGGGGGSF